MSPSKISASAPGRKASTMALPGHDAFEAFASSTELLKLPIWAPASYPEDGSPAERIATSYERAKTVARHVDMSVEDIIKLTSKFWSFHTDFITVADTATTTILTIHWNLCIGTIASYTTNQPDLIAILDELRKFESVGEFMLTEVGHGLDARNIETTATLNQDGSFELHTPTPAAAKIMPPTTPHARMPRLAVVFAQLVVQGENRGVRPFVVRINTAEAMAHGVTSRLLPMRPGARMVDHAITTFQHVRLEPWALLGGVEASDNPRKDFFRHIHRVTVGTMSLSMTSIAVLRLSGYILGRYSQRRTVAGQKADQRVPIITFSTQYTPVLTALTTASVLEAYAADTREVFMSTKEPRIRSGLACIFKQTSTGASQALLNEMIDRCGWQGLFAHNQIIELTMALRGNSIAEGDSLVLCIRLVSELLLGRYEIPKARDPKCLLAQHEISIWKEATRLSKKIMIMAGSNRNEKFNAAILPRCRKLVQAIGHRMAYEAAAASDLVTPDMLRFYEASCLLEDPAWYVEKKKFTTSDLHIRHADAATQLLPRLEFMLQQSGAAPWATAPILKEQAWMEFLDRLPTFTHDGSASDFQSTLGANSGSSQVSVVSYGTHEVGAAKLDVIETNVIPQVAIEEKNDFSRQSDGDAVRRNGSLAKWWRGRKSRLSVSLA